MKIIDPNNPIPKYLQISAWIKDLIQSGRYEKGATLPSEVELARICQVNRNTLRQAISELTAAGILRKDRGRGTFVCAETPQAIKHKLKSISSFSDDLRELGIREKTRIIKKGAEEAKGDVARKLIISPNSEVVAVRRLRTGNNVPFIYEESFLPYTAFKAILDEVAEVDLRARKVRAEDLMDRRFLDEMEKSGFFDKLWGRKGLLSQFHSQNTLRDFCQPVREWTSWTPKIKIGLRVYQRGSRSTTCLSVEYW